MIKKNVVFALSYVLTLCVSTAIGQGNVTGQSAEHGKSASAKSAGDAATVTGEAEKLLDDYRGQGNALILAARKLRQALKVDPNYAKTYTQVCRLQIMGGYISDREFEAGSLDLAEKAILTAIELDPKNADAYVLQGHLYIQMERFEEARKALLTGGNLGTDSPWLNLDWAELYLRTGEPLAAASIYEDTLRRGVTNPKALAVIYEGLTQHYVKTRQWDKADAMYRENVKLDPNRPWTRGNYAGYLVNAGQNERAISYAREALQIMDYGVGRETLANALFYTWADKVLAGEDQDKIQPLFDEALQINPNLRKRLERLLVSDNPNAQIVARVLIKRGLVQKAQ